MAGMRGVAATKATGNLPTSLPLARAVGASIANAPDRGALIRYADQKVGPSDGAFTYYPVAISEEHALKAIVTGEMAVPSPDGSSVKLRYERHDEHADGNWTWIGRVAGGVKGQEAIITFGEKAVFGSIPRPGGAPPLEVITRGGKLLVSVMDPNKASRAISEGGDMLIPPAAAARTLVSASAQSAVAQSAVAVAAPPTPANTVDLAVGYSSGLAARIGSDSGAVTRMVNLVSFANEALRNSDVNGYFRLVNAVKISYADTTTNLDALQKLTGSTGSASVAIPGELTPLRNAREQYGADLAILVRDFKSPEQDGCGIAWLNGADRTAIDPVADAAWAYAIVSDGEDRGSDGKDYFCASETLAHEAGHLMGSAHDRANSKKSNGDLQYGVYDYSFGYNTSVANGNFYTVMSYGANGQIAQRIFSTPQKSVCGASMNLPCGVVNSEDNARSLNQTIPIVAQFRATVVPLASKVRNDIDADGKSDIVFQNTAAGLMSVWKMNGPAVTTSWTQSVSGIYRIVASGDFDGDGRVDLLWTNNTNDTLWIWKSNAGGTFTIQTVGSYPAGWSVVGAGDIDGDGKADIVFQNATAGLMSVWAMNGTSVRASWTNSVASIYRVVGIGDFNGDGRADILWTNSANDSIWYWLSSGNGAFTVQFVSGYPPVWSIVGVADLTGDGVAEIVFQNRPAGLVSIWKKGVGTDLTIWTRSVGTIYRIVALGDYDGDGNSDMLWTNDANDTLWIWKSVGDGNFNISLVGGYPPTWAVQSGGK